MCANVLCARTILLCKETIRDRQRIIINDDAPYYIVYTQNFWSMCDIVVSQNGWHAMRVCGPNRFPASGLPMAAG